MNETRAAEAKNALAWLRNIIRTRLDLRKSVELKGQLTSTQVIAMRMVDDAKQAQLKADEELAQAIEAERTAHMKQVGAETLLNEVEEKNTRFNQVIGDKTCRYCGQLLTPEHIENEKMALARELEESKQIVHAAKEQHKLFSEQLRSAEQALSAVKQKTGEADTALRELNNRLAQLELHIPNYLATLQEAYSSLPTYYQGLFAAVRPDTIERWLGTTYPSNEEIVHVEREGNQLKTHHDEVERLRIESNKCSQAKAFLKGIENDLVDTRGKLPPNSETAWEQNEEAQSAKADAEGALTSGRIKLQGIKGDQTTVDTSITELQSKRTAASNGVNNERTRQGEINTSLENYTHQLDTVWLSQLDVLDQQKIKELEVDRNNLAQYEGLFQGLETARQTIKGLSGRIEGLEKQICDIPEEARIDPGKLKNSLTAAQKASTEASNEKSQAETNLRLLTERKGKRAEIEAQKLAADRKVHLYGILAEQFGEQGIQQALVNRAENEIVNKANDVLYNLSAGRWSLALRERGKNKKALDMVVFDAKTGGNMPIPIVLASGSQRFRIAISLALAIGQYIRQESHRIESVIIDEGFGSLDKIGRDDTIQESRNLHQHLERIILVSHQEEFYGTFSTGYGIDIVDGASKVTLFE